MRLLACAILLSCSFAVRAGEQPSNQKNWQLKTLTLHDRSVIKGLVVEEEGIVYFDDGTGPIDVHFVHQIGDLPEAEKPLLLQQIERRRAELVDKKKQQVTSRTPVVKQYEIQKPSPEPKVDASRPTEVFNKGTDVDQ